MHQTLKRTVYFAQSATITIETNDLFVKMTKPGLLIIIVSVATLVHANSEECDPREEMIAQATNDQIKVLDLAADVLWERTGKEVPEEKVKLPVWKYMGRPNDRHSCISLPTDLTAWVAKMEAVRRALRETNDEANLKSFSDMLEAFLKHAELLYGSQLPEKTITQYNLAGSERDILGMRSKYPFFNETMVVLLSRIPKGKFLLNKLGLGASRKIVDIPNTDIPLEFPQKEEKWPSYSSRELLKRIFDKKVYPPCPYELIHTNTFEETPFTIRHIPSQRIQTSFKGYESLNAIVAVEQLRYLCSSDNETFSIVTQSARPLKAKLHATGFKLSVLTEAFSLLNQSIVHEHWQRVVSLRMRQVLEVVNLLGWVVRDLSDDNIWLDFDRGMLPIIMDISSAFSINQTLWRYPNYKGVRNAGQTVQIQLALFDEQDTNKVHAWVTSFGAGFNDLVVHAKEFLDERTATIQKEKDKKLNGAFTFDNLS